MDAERLPPALERERGARHARRDAVVAAREPLARAAVAEARARLRARVREGEGVADGAAGAAAGEGGHFVLGLVVLLMRALLEDVGRGVRGGGCCGMRMIGRMTWCEDGWSHISSFIARYTSWWRIRHR